MRVRESILRDIGRLIIWYPVRWFITFLPTKIDFLFFKILGDIAFIFQKSKRDLLLSRFSAYLTYPDEKILKEFVRKNIENHFIDRLHIFLYPRLRLSLKRTLITIAGEEKLRKSLAKGNGVILLHGHFGPIQLQLLELSRRGYDISQIGFLSDDNLSYIGKKVAFRLRGLCESKIGAKIIRADGFLREAFRTLKKGGIIMMTGDGAGAGKFIGKYSPVKFLGERMLFPTGAYSLSDRTGAEILPVTIHRQRYDRYCINIYEPLIESTDGESDNPPQDFAEFLEDKVSSYPCHWHFWDDFIPGKLILDDKET